MHLGHQKLLKQEKQQQKKRIEAGIDDIQSASIYCLSKVDPEAMQYLTSLSQKEAHMADLESTIFTKWISLQLLQI